MAGKITYIYETPIKNKKVLLRVDFNVSLNPDHTIANDARIKQSIPTINYLLKNNNRLIIVSHLGRPKNHDINFSLLPVANDLQSYLPNYKVILVNDFTSQDGKKIISEQKENEIILLENIRFYPGEEQNDPVFTQTLANLGEVYVNDAFGVCNRVHSSIVGITKYLPSYAGLLLEKEIEIISKAIANPQKPFIAIIGGAKISDKMNLLWRLTEIADHLLIGGGLANTFLAAQGFKVGKSLYDSGELDKVRQLFFFAAEKNTVIQLPLDVVVGTVDGSTSEVKKVADVSPELQILDIGPETLIKFRSLIASAKTIVWNGPVGYFENPLFRKGTDSVYNAIVENSTGTSIVGGGDTLNAISQEEFLNKITHISTGGGAMLEFIEKGTLPGIDALKK